MLQIKRVSSNNLLNKCKDFLSKNPTINILILADCYLPFLNFSKIYCAIENDQIVGICSINQRNSENSIVFGEANPQTKEVLLENSLKQLPTNFISVCRENEILLFKEYTTILKEEYFYQMITDKLKKIELQNAKTEKVFKETVKELEIFYINHQSEVLAPQFIDLGPFYYIKEKDQIVSAAGTQILTPQIAQIGSIYTEKSYRKLGFATACIRALCSDLFLSSPIISLFVNTSNKPAINLYKKIGFKKTEKIVYLELAKKKGRIDGVLASQI